MTNRIPPMRPTSNSRCRSPMSAAITVESAMSVNSRLDRTRSMATGPGLPPAVARQRAVARGEPGSGVRWQGAVARTRPMSFVVTPHGLEDYAFWQATDRATLKRINRLLDPVSRDPLSKIGKPGHLRHALAGAWSRRIGEEHRLMYLVEVGEVVILQARYHYG